VDPAPNGVAAEQKEVVEERIVAAVNIIAEQQQDGDVAIGNVLSDTMIPATHKLAQHNVMPSTDFGRAIPET
ncbi:hypothetical protein A2U01_0108933, partial [Trifolium medium]|nr:hypothetical protein [Trifolium medium]